MLIGDWSFWEFALLAVAILLLIRLLPAGIFLVRLMRIPIQMPVVVPSSESEVPDSVRSLLRDAAGPLLEDGFRESRFLRSRRLEQSQDSWYWALLLHHRESSSFGIVSISDSPDAYEPARATFYTFFESGRGLIAMSGLAFGL